MTSSLNSRIALFALLLGAVACNKAPQQDLKSVKVPAGFTFQTSRSVAVKVSGSPALLTSAGRLTIARPDGRVLFDGRLSSHAETSVSLALPTKDNALLATLTLPNGQTLHQQIAVVGNAAVHTFE